MKTELDILREVSKRLDAAGIQYMVTSSVAMNYYAQPRMTRDIDVVMALKDSDAVRLLDLFGADYVQNYNCETFATCSDLIAIATICAAERKYWEWSNSWRSCLRKNERYAERNR